MLVSQVYSASDIHVKALYWRDTKDIAPSTKMPQVRIRKKPGVVAHASNPRTWETEAGGSLNLRSAWSIEQISGQLEL